MRPIPHALLPHSAALYTAETDAEGTRTLTLTAQLSRVRIEPESAQTLTADETQSTQNALLIYDMRSSLPKNTAFAVGQYIQAQEAMYRVEAVKAYHDGRRLHHVELELRG